MEAANSAVNSEIINLQQQVFRLQALLEAARHVHETNREDAVLDSVLRIVVRELEMPGAAFPAENLTHGQAPEWDSDFVLTYPLKDSDGSILTSLVVARPVGREVTLYETDFLEGLALQAAVALENARNHERNLQWARVQRDLEAARAIQRSLLPQQMPQIPGYTIAVRSDTCYEVGGDYVDIVSFSESDHIMVVADVAGKGLASAMMATSFRSAFRALAVTGLPLDELANRMNQLHWNEGEEARRRYVTAIFLRLSASDGCLQVVNAGHNAGLLVYRSMTTSEAQPSVVQIEASGSPLGLIPGIRYATEEHAFPPGSRLLFYTDGLTEVFRDPEEEFGPERLMAAFSSSKEHHAGDMLDSLWSAIGEFAPEFSPGVAQGDDMTALALGRHMPEAAE